jgi:hypothetical protein
MLTGTNLTTLKDEAQKIVYTVMIPSAWKVAPGDYSPFILVSDNPCSSDPRLLQQQDLLRYHPQRTNNRGKLVDWKLNVLPG